MIRHNITFYFEMQFFYHLILHLKLHFRALHCRGTAFLDKWLSPGHYLVSDHRDKLFLTLSDRYHITSAEKLQLIFTIIASSGIQTWDLSFCLYLNLKHDDLDHTDGSILFLFFRNFQFNCLYFWCFFVPFSISFTRINMHSLSAHTHKHTHGAPLTHTHLYFLSIGNFSIKAKYDEYPSDIN